MKDKAEVAALRAAKEILAPLVRARSLNIGSINDLPVSPAKIDPVHNQKYIDIYALQTLAHDLWLKDEHAQDIWKNKSCDISLPSEHKHEFKDGVVVMYQSKLQKVYDLMSLPETDAPDVKPKSRKRRGTATDRPNTKRSKKRQDSGTSTRNSLQPSPQREIKDESGTEPKIKCEPGTEHDEDDTVLHEAGPGGPAQSNQNKSFSSIKEFKKNKRDHTTTPASTATPCPTTESEWQALASHFDYVKRDGTYVKPIQLAHDAILSSFDYQHVLYDPETAKPLDMDKYGRDKKYYYDGLQLVFGFDRENPSPFADGFREYAYNYLSTEELRGLETCIRFLKDTVAEAKEKKQKAIGPLTGNIDVPSPSSISFRIQSHGIKTNANIATAALTSDKDKEEGKKTVGKGNTEGGQTADKGTTDDKKATDKGKEEGKKAVGKGDTEGGQTAYEDTTDDNKAADKGKEEDKLTVDKGTMDSDKAVGGVDKAVGGVDKEEGKGTRDDTGANAGTTGTNVGNTIKHEEAVVKDEKIAED